MSKTYFQAVDRKLKNGNIEFLSKPVDGRVSRKSVNRELTVVLNKADIKLSY